MDFLKGIFNGSAESVPSAASGVPGSGISNATGMVGDIFKGGLNFITGGISGMILDGVKGIIAAPIAGLKSFVAAYPVVAGVGVGLFILYRTRARLFNFLVRNSGLSAGGIVAVNSVSVVTGVVGNVIDVGANCLNQVLSCGNKFLNFFRKKGALDDLMENSKSKVNETIENLKHDFVDKPAKDLIVDITNDKDYTKEQKAFSEKFCTLALNILDSIGFFYGIEV